MSIINKALQLLPPEGAHGVAKWAMKHKLLAPGRYVSSESLDAHCRIFGWDIDNRLGLAAGFDKNGELVGVADRYGFGWIEVGSVTYRGGKGNPKPRLFRLKDGALLNRMGLNGDPAEQVVERIRMIKGWRSQFAINIAKTHDPKIVGDHAIKDMALTYRLVHDMGMYTAINISCPNTTEGRTFTDDMSALDELLGELQAMSTASSRPRVVKLSPDLMYEALKKIIRVCKSRGIKGYVVSNTIPTVFQKHGKGGLSGPDVKPRALKMIAWMRLNGVDETIIGCGGVQTGQDMRDYINEGADAVQAYAGFVNGPLAGPDFAHKVLKEFAG